MKIFNLHTHSIYSDGADEPRVYAEEALKQHFSSLGFSEHAPLPFDNNFSILEQQMEDYCKNIRSLKEEFKNKLEIFLSLEFDYIPGISKPFKNDINKYKLDYSIGSVHLVANENKEGLWFIDGPKVETYDAGLMNLFEGDARHAVETYYHQLCMMIEEESPDIVGHLDKIKMHNQHRYFSEDESWYRKLITRTLNLIADAGLILEVNTRGIYKKRCDSLFPGIKVLAEALHMGIPITLTTDAHKPNEISRYYFEGLKLLYDMGFRDLKAFRDGEWMDVNIRGLRTL